MVSMVIGCLLGDEILNAHCGVEGYCEVTRKRDYKIAFGG